MKTEILLKEGKKQIPEENKEVIEHDLYENKDINYETKALTLQQDGYDVFTSDDYHVYKEQELTSIQSLFTRIQVDNLGTSVILETGDFETIWREEMQSTTITKNANISKITIKMHELIAAPIISRRLLQLSQFDVRSYVKKNVTRSLLYNMDLSTMIGNGIHEPAGILSYDIVFENPKKQDLFAMKLNPKVLIADLLKMENQLPLIYRNGAAWIISRTLFNELQSALLNMPNGNGTHALIRDGINYQLFGRKVVIFDGLNENNKKIQVILIHPSAYTVLDNPNLDVIENNQDVDVKLIFIKNFGGAVTNPKAMILGAI